MKIIRSFSSSFCLLVLWMVSFQAVAFQTAPAADAHVWEMQEITLKAEKAYSNYYTDVTVWVDLKGPDFSKRVYGFWDGDNIFKVRLVATKPGQWEWTSGSNQHNYFARAQMYGSVLSGGLAGHVHGTDAYDMTTTGEPAGARPQIWDALKYESGNQMQHMKSFVLSEGERYQKLQPYHQCLHPQKARNSSVRGLDGWSFMMLNPEKDFALLYFENKAELPRISGLKKNTNYAFQWFNPRNGERKTPEIIKSDRKGNLTVPKFPDGSNPASTDWAAKILESR